MSQTTPRKNKRPFKQRKLHHNQTIHQQPPQQYYDLSEDSDSDVPLDYIDDMLEDSLKESLECKNQLPSHEERKKIVLKKREKDYFEVLPEGWLEVTHLSGMPIYLHRSSRVCTLSKPYYLGSGSSRKHEIPVSAIPCLAYRKELEKEKQLNDEHNNLDQLNNENSNLNQLNNEHSNLDQSNNEHSNLDQLNNKCPYLNDKLSNNQLSLNSQIELNKDETYLNKDNDQIENEIKDNNEILNKIDNKLINKQIDNNEEMDFMIVNQNNQELNLESNEDNLTLNKDQQTEDNNQLNLINNNQTLTNKKPLFIAKVETVKDNKKERSLNYMKVREYCERLFEFQEITIRKFKTWADRRNHMQQRKLAQRPSLPESTKLITCPLPVNKSEQGTEIQRKNKLFQMNPDGKSSVCILHEFIQHVERVQPKYAFQELENANTPYSATVIINNMQYGTGYGSSKKQAKSEAAKATLNILIPDYDKKELTHNGTTGNKAKDLNTNDLSFFDDIKVEDPRVSELCAKAGQHSPYQILVECLRRNCGMGDTDITTEVRLVKHQKNEFTMKVGSNTATVLCRNKREGKQFAAQAILQILHPNIQNWGSLLRLYGRGSCKTPKEKKEEEQKITELQNTACANKPNYAILNKLREEMLKLKGSDYKPDEDVSFNFLCLEQSNDNLKED